MTLESLLNAVALSSSGTYAGIFSGRSWESLQQPADGRWFPQGNVRFPPSIILVKVKYSQVLRKTQIKINKLTNFRSATCGVLGLPAGFVRSSSHYYPYRRRIWVKCFRSINLLICRSIWCLIIFCLKSRHHHMCVSVFSPMHWLTSNHSHYSTNDWLFSLKTPVYCGQSTKN